MMPREQTRVPSLEELAQLADACFAELPREFRDLVDGIVFTVEEIPDRETVRRMGLRSELALLGLFRGANLAARTANHGAFLPTMITLYRRPILHYWAHRDESLKAIVRHVLVHEIGHHFGLSDAAMHTIESGA
ncbi:MAG TPA: metallopeptidase family protein [Rhizomicrobium sp.]|nr:metallopeptidase family protein [Rhizomicrobium sp.]